MHLGPPSASQLRTSHTLSHPPPGSHSPPVSCQYNWGRFPTFALPLPSHTEEALISVKLPSLSATDATQCTQPPILSNEVALYIQTYRCQTLASNIFTSCRSTFSSIIYCKPFYGFVIAGNQCCENHQTSPITKVYFTPGSFMFTLKTITGRVFLKPHEM